MKKLLIICQAVDADSSTLGFFIEWLKEFSRQCDEVRVIGQSVGRYELPANIRVASMGKERGASKIVQLWNLWKLAWRWLPEVDGMFVHMSPEYVLAAAPLAAIRRKPIVLWYAHKSVTARLRLAARLCRAVVASAPAGLKIGGSNAKFLGQGIPTERFTIAARVRQPKLLSVGRITRVKNIDLMIRGLAELRRRGVAAELTLVGEPVTDEDRAYQQELRNLVGTLGVAEAVRLRGGARYDELPAIYATHALHLNLAPTGAPDKAVFEAMASGLPVIVANETFTGYLGGDAARMIVKPEADDIAEKTAVLLADNDPALPERLREIVERRHSLAALVRGIMELI